MSERIKTDSEHWWDKGYAKAKEEHAAEALTLRRNYPILVACALIVEKGWVLMERHAPRDNSEGYLWDLPGGKVEIGETPAECVVREIREEMNVEIEVVRMLPRLDISQWGDKHWVLAVYECRILSGRPPFSGDLQWQPISLLSEAYVKTPDVFIVRDFAAGKL